MSNELELLWKEIQDLRARVFHLEALECPISLALTGGICIADGDKQLPGLRFCSDPDTGFYRYGDNQIGILVGGATAGYWGPGLNVGTATGAGPGQGFFSDKVQALTAFLDGAGTTTAKNTALSLHASVLLMQENGAANDQAQITLTFNNTGAGTRNFAYARMLVRVGYLDEVSFADLTGIYLVQIAQTDNGSESNERYFNVTALIEHAATGGWTPPGVGGFVWASSSATTLVFTIQHLGIAEADVDVQVFEGLNIASVAAALV